MFDAEIIDWMWERKLVKIKAGNEYNLEKLFAMIGTLELLDIRTLHLHIEENILDKLLQTVIENKYLFRAYVDDSYQYYKWLLVNVEDKVHPYATSTAGATAVILSPDEKSILMIHEYDMWKCVTGSNDYRELSLETASREMLEEVGLVNDPDFVPKMIGLWNISGRFGGYINNVMTCYIFKSKTLDAKPDEFEISLTKWFSLDELKPIIELAKTKTNLSGQPFDRSYITYGGERFGYCYLLWINNWINNKCMECEISGNINIIH